PSDLRTVDLRARQGTFLAVRGALIRLQALLGRAAPVADARLVSHLPEPTLYLGAAVPSYGMAHPLIDQLAPLGVVLWRVRPTGVDLRVVPPRLPRMLVRSRLGRQRLGHEPDLDQRPHLPLEIGIHDAINDG